VKEEIKISLELLQEIVNYLQLKPHHEVHELIAKIIKESKEE
jgi:hypothetical protein